MSTLIKFDGKNCGTMSCGYTGKNDRVAAAINQMFAPEIAIAGLSTQLSGLASVTEVAVQSVGGKSGGIQLG